MQTESLDFNCDILEQSHDIPVLVDFWAEWCGPCRMLGPVLESLAKKHSGKFLLVKVNTEEYPEIAQRYGIMSIPAVKLFIKGEIAGEFVGALPEDNIEQWLKKTLPSRYAEEIELAAGLVAEGKEFKAVPILEEVLKNESGNREATAMLARLKLFGSPEQAVILVSMLEEDEEFSELVSSVAILAELLARKSDTYPDGPSKELYMKAADELRGKNFDAALDAFIGVLREDRYYDDDGARKACIAVFKYLGEEHPVTLKHRKVFDRALY